MVGLAGPATSDVLVVRQRMAALRVCCLQFQIYIFSAIRLQEVAKENFNILTYIIMILGKFLNLM